MKRTRLDHLTSELRAKVNILRKLNVRVSNDHPGGHLHFWCPAWPRTEPDGPARGYSVDEIDQAIKHARFRWGIIKPGSGQPQLFTHPAATKGCERWKKKLIIRFKNKQNGLEGQTT